jgi:dTMP kinase
MLQPTEQRARLVSFAGLDGAGKTTQSLRLAAWLRQLGLATAVHAPHGPSFVRQLLSRVAADAGLDDYTRYLGPGTTRLVGAVVRYRDWSRAVFPALESGQFVITDRWAACHYASVRAAGADNEHVLRELFRPLPDPDLTLFLEVRPECAWRRVQARGVDSQTLEFLHAYDRAYRALPEFSEFAPVDGNGTIDQVQQLLREQLVRRFPEVAAAAGSGTSLVRTAGR